MPRIKDVRTTIYEWVGPVAPMPPHFCTTASDLVSEAAIKNRFFKASVDESRALVYAA